MVELVVLEVEVVELGPDIGVPVGEEVEGGEGQMGEGVQIGNWEGVGHGVQNELELEVAHFHHLAERVESYRLFQSPELEDVGLHQIPDPAHIGHQFLRQPRFPQSVPNLQFHPFRVVSYSQLFQNRVFVTVRLHRQVRVQRNQQRVL